MLAIPSSLGVEQLRHEEDEAKTDGTSDQETTKVEFQGRGGAVLASAGAVGSLYSKCSHCVKYSLQISMHYTHGVDRVGEETETWAGASRRFLVLGAGQFFGACGEFQSRLYSKVHDS